jgi:hypothetical protein
MRQERMQREAEVASHAPGLSEQPQQPEPALTTSSTGNGHQTARDHGLNVSESLPVEPSIERRIEPLIDLPDAAGSARAADMAEVGLREELRAKLGDDDESSVDAIIQSVHDTTRY